MSINFFDLRIHRRFVNLNDFGNFLAVQLINFLFSSTSISPFSHSDLFLLSFSSNFIFYFFIHSLQISYFISSFILFQFHILFLLSFSSNFIFYFFFHSLPNLCFISSFILFQFHILFLLSFSFFFLFFPSFIFFLLFFFSVFTISSPISAFLHNIFWDRFLTTALSPSFDVRIPLAPNTYGKN